MTTATAKPLPDHGTLYRRKTYQCACNDCHRAERDYMNNRSRQIAYGRWQPLVDAEPARAHVRALMDYGLGWGRVADQAGVSRGTVEKLLYGAPHRNMGPSKRIRPEAAAKLLAIQPEPGSLGAVAGVDATGTRRRLQALAAAGWPLSHLCTRLGIHRGNLGKTLRGTHVRISTDRTVRALYDALWDADPLDNGVSLHSYNRARKHAGQQQWAPVGAWDDDTIDDPTSFPDWTGRCGTPQGYSAHHAHKIPVCQPCRNAASEARRQKRAAA